MRNEYIFLTQLIAISFFLKKFNNKNQILLLNQIIVVSYILMNLLANYEVVLFGINSSIIEPLAVANYFISIYIWNYDKILAKKITNNLFFSSLFSIGILGFLLLYKCQDANNLINQFIYNISISILVIQIAYRIERLIFTKLTKLPLIWRAKISILISQLFDSIVYTAFIFYNKPIINQIQIALFSYIIKVICILVYTLSQLSIKSKKNNNQFFLTKKD